MAMSAQQLVFTGPWPFTAFVQFLLGVMALFLLACVVGSRLAWVRQWQAERLAKQVGLGIPRELEGVIRSRVAGQLLWGGLGGLAGLGAVLAAYLAMRVPFGPVELYGTFAGAVTGYGIAITWVSLRSAFAPEHGPRLARLMDVGLGDYIPAPARILAWVVLGLAAIATTLELWRPSAGHAGHPMTATGIPLVGIAAACLIAFEVLGRRLVRRGQPAATTDELVWDDALRSSALRAVLLTPQQALCLGMLWSVGAGDGARTEYWVAAPMGLLLIGFALLAAIIRNTTSWYLEQLWPGARRRTPEEERARLDALT